MTYLFEALIFVVLILLVIHFLRKPKCCKCWGPADVLNITANKDSFYCDDCFSKRRGGNG